MLKHLQIERFKINLKYMRTFYYEEIARIYVWWLWNIPFQLFSIIVALLIYNYFALAFGGESPFYGDNFIAFIISGLMVNTYLDTSLEAYYDAMAALFFGKMGIGGITISKKDYLQLAGIPPYIFIVSRTTFNYLADTIMFILYFIIGALFFGFHISIHAYLIYVPAIILLGIIACTGLGLISASMYWLIGSHRGVEPIRWFIKMMVPLVSGVYVPQILLPKELVLIGNMLPQTYTINGVRKILLEGATFTQLVDDLTKLIAQALVLVPSGLIILKYSLSLERRRGTIYG